jgi:hypothetical protein
MILLSLCLYLKIVIVNNARSDGSLNVESYPSEIFTGVVHIVDQAEFTPPKEFEPRKIVGQLPLQ